MEYWKNGMMGKKKTRGLRFREHHEKNLDMTFLQHWVICRFFKPNIPSFQYSNIPYP